MENLNRRRFLQSVAAAAVAGGNFSDAKTAAPEPMRMGLLVSATSEPEKVMDTCVGSEFPRFM